MEKPEWDRMEERLALARLLASRLERISADSIWARRASGIRGNLLKLIEIMESRAGVGGFRPSSLDQSEEEILARADRLIRSSFDILAKAAREIPDSEEH